MILDLVTFLVPVRWRDFDWALLSKTDLQEVLGLPGDFGEMPGDL